MYTIPVLQNTLQQQYMLSRDKLVRFTMLAKAMRQSELAKLGYNGFCIKTE